MGTFATRIAVWVPTAIGLAACGALAIVVRMGHGDASELSGRQKELAARLAQLEKGSSETSLRERNEFRQTLTDSIGAPIGEKQASADESPDARPQNPREFHSNEELSAAFEAAYAVQPKQSAWTSDARETYQETIERFLPDTSKLVSFDCRADFCRLEAIHEDVRTTNAFLGGLFAQEQGGPLATSSGGFRSASPTLTADGKLRHVIFIARPGVPLELAPEQ